MICLDDFSALQRRVEKIRQQRDQSAGAAAQLRDRLQKEYGCADATAARAKLAEIEKRESALGDEYLAQKKAFEKMFGALLEEVR